MYRIEQTPKFEAWQNRIKRTDPKSAVRITIRLQRVVEGNFGDHKQLTENLYELRMHFGPGFRVYFAKFNSKLLVLLIGGNKSTQKLDVLKAKELMMSLGEDHE